MLHEDDIVITGLGLITPLGMDTNSVWQDLVSGKSGIAKLPKERDFELLSSKVAGKECPNFNPEQFMNKRNVARSSKCMHYAVASASLAINDSGALESPLTNLSRVGVSIGSGIGGLSVLESGAIKSFEEKKCSPFTIPSSLINLISGHVSIENGITGPNFSLVSACASGASAICCAARMLKLDELDVVIAGGSEAATCKTSMNGFASMFALSNKFNDEPEKASRPWDKKRDGFVMSEGAGILIMEKASHAKTRGAKIYARLSGYGESSDAYHISSPHPEGNGAIASMQLALKRSGLKPENISHINAHSTSTPLGDNGELFSIKQVFGQHATSKEMTVSSTKSSIGHLLGAAGGVESIFSILSLQTSIAPPNINLFEPDNPLSINLTGREKVKMPNIQHVLSNSFGFGGSNVSLIFSKV